MSGSDLGPALVLLIVLGLVAWQARALLLAKASAGWPRTRGRVLSAYLDETQPDEDGDVSHSAHVRYRYQVGRHHYTSTRLSYRPTRYLGFSDAAELLDGIVQGREVEVSYDPQRPQRAVLVPGSSTANLVHLLLAVLLSLWPLYYLVA